MTSLEKAEPNFNADLEQQKLDALAEFAAGAGHEINNPLTVISGHAQYLFQQAKDPDIRYHLGVILAQTRRAYEMIADLRTFARPPVPQRRPASLFEIIDSLIEERKEDLELHSIKINASYHNETKESSPFLLLDSAQVQTILGALIKNAAEAILEHGQIYLDAYIKSISSIPEVRTLPTDWERSTELMAPTEPAIPLNAHANTEDKFESGFMQRVQVQILLEDSGPGIVSEEKQHLFTPYWSGRSSGRGLGFGLPKVYRLLQGLGGSIQLEPTHHQSMGCCWKIEFETVVME